jgi:hypothetical protein
MPVRQLHRFRVVHEEAGVIEPAAACFAQRPFDGDIGNIDADDLAGLIGEAEGETPGTTAVLEYPAAA